MRPVGHRGEFEVGAAELCLRYVDALNAGDLQAIEDLFTPDATVLSPVYGPMNAHEFHRVFFADTDRTKPQVRGLFDHANNGQGAALHLSFSWTFADQETVEFEAVDLFELSPEGRFRKLTIVYDSQPVRKAWQAFQQRRLESAAAATVLDQAHRAA
ncbi:MAG: nuclear transport factor 2 family protein [Proteobacteria bacterium]|nr:nuclear transport factor 2 family protein [Pseudomonadota bacterium]